MFTVAHDAIRNHADLEKVIIMEHPERNDDHNIDPISLKPSLAKFANSTFNQLWMESPFKSQIIVAAHSVFSVGETKDSILRDDTNNKYDGVHMYGPAGTKAYTKSLINILNQIGAPSAKKKGTSSVKSGDHANCPQAKYQRYSIPVNNRFKVLGN